MIKIVIFVSVIICSKTSQDLDTMSPGASKVQLFSHLNRQLHNLSRILFTSLYLGHNSTNANKVNTLIKMADDLINLAESKFRIYREVHNDTKIEVDNKAINALFNLTQVIEEIFKEEHYFLRNNKFLRNDSFVEFYEAVVSNANWLEKSLKDWESPEINTNLMDFRRKGSVSNFRRKRRKDKETLIKNKRKRRRDLLYWQASNETDQPTRRVFMSETTKIKRYPFIASIQLMDEFVCAGSIVGKNFVLTAASCLQLAHQNPDFLRQPKAYTVRVGSSYTTKKGSVIRVIGVYFHPGYHPTYLSSNLALAKLETALNFLRSKGTLRRLYYDQKRRIIQDGSDVIVIGWGDRENDHAYNGILTRAHLRTSNLKGCQKIYSARYVTRTDFCAGKPDELGGGAGACNRDVGGPVIIGSKLIGIVSFGHPVCGTPNAPSVFTRVGDHATWIKSVISGTTEQYKHLPKTKTEHKTLKKKYKLQYASQIKDPNKSVIKFLGNVIKDVRDNFNMDMNDNKLKELKDKFSINKLEPEVPGGNDDFNYDFLNKKETADKIKDSDKLKDAVDKFLEPESFSEEFSNVFGNFWTKVPIEEQMLQNPLLNLTLIHHKDLIKKITTTTSTTLGYDPTPTVPTESLEVLDFAGTTTKLPHHLKEKFDKYRDLIEYFIPQTTRFVPILTVNNFNKKIRRKKSRQTTSKLVHTLKPSKEISEENAKLFNIVDAPGGVESSELAQEFTYQSLENFLTNVDMPTNDVLDKPFPEKYEKRKPTFKKREPPGKMYKMKRKDSKKVRKPEAQDLSKGKSDVGNEMIVAPIIGDYGNGQERDLDNYQMSAKDTRYKMKRKDSKKVRKPEAQDLPVAPIDDYGNVQERDLDNYQMPAKNMKSDEDRTRRLLHYVNI